MSMTGIAAASRSTFAPIHTLASRRAVARTSRHSRIASIRFPCLATSPKAKKASWEARGVVTLCLAQHNIALGEYTPNQIKQAVTGTTSADKKVVEQYVKLLLGLETEPKPDHAADALAGAITHVHFSTCALKDPETPGR